MSGARSYGRLAAVLEHLGYLDDRAVGLASTSPQRLVQPLGQATGSGERARDMLTPILAEIPASGEPFPATLPNLAQSDFWLGYFHQRNDFRAGLLPKLPDLDDEPWFDARWEIRIEADLKAWVLENGGSKLVRALLRQARDSQQR